MMKGQKGITLVALVITIIVMLILVTVTVTVAMRGGLFDQARSAASNTNEAAQAEQDLANGMVNYGGQMVSINNIVDGSVPATPAT